MSCGLAWDSSCAYQFGRSGALTQAWEQKGKVLGHMVVAQTPNSILLQSDVLDLLDK